MGCQTNHYKDSIVLDNGVRVKFFEVSTCDKNQNKRYANFNISAKTKNGKLVFSSKYQSLESVSSFYYDSLLAFGMGELFEELCEGDSVSFSIPSGMFIKGIFHNNSTTKFKSVNEIDSLDVHLKFISFKIFLIFFLSAGLKIFLDIPPPLFVLGIKTQYFPANDNLVVTAAPLLPLSSFTT